MTKAITKIRKRDGRIVDFEQEKITKAISKALTATKQGDAEKAQKLSDRVMNLALQRFKAEEIPAVEQIQDIVEEVLILEGYTETAKSYILYREQHRRIREAMTAIDETVEMVDQYIEELDWQVKENANMAYSLQGLNHYITSAVTKKYWLDKIYPPNIRQAVESGDFHIHNLDSLATYCCGWDLYDLLIKGFGGVAGKVESKPAKHFLTVLSQTVNFFYTLQGESAGAQAFSNFDTLLAPFVRYDNLSYHQVKQGIQMFLFNLAIPTRVGFQTPFTNITLDITPSPTLANQPVIIAGQPQKENYSEFQEEMNMINRALFETMMEGDAKQRVFTFPIPTINITRDFPWDEPALMPMWEATAKYGVNYFSNFIQSDMKPEDVRSMCCRLRLDNSELLKRGGGLFGSNPLTGCYDEKTEILTENGWKLFKDLNKRDEVFTLTENNEIEIHKPKRLFKYNYEGEMYQFKTRSLDLLVTPNHRMVIDQVGSGKRKFVEAENFDSNNQRIPKQSIWQGEEKEWFILPGIELTKYGRQGRTPYQIKRDALKIKMDNWLKFFGFWLAEGCTDNEKIAPRHGYRVVITQVNKKKKQEIKEILDALPFNYAEEKNNLVICNKQLWSYLRQFGKKYDKFIPQEIKNLSKRQLKILFDWMVKGDGHIRKTNGQINYWTSSKGLADDLQEIILKLGWLGTLIVQKKKIARIKGRKVKAGICYILGVQKAQHYRLRKNNIQKVNYKGKVYCCEVKNHTVFVRRNGKVSWCGNSIGVVTINMPRLGYLSKTKKEFFERLGTIMNLIKESLETKRKALENFIEKGLYPYSKFYLDGVKKARGAYFGNHFSTIGLVGMNEGLLNFTGENIGSENGRKFTLEILDFMREKLVKYQEETGNLYNLEATPAESTAYRLALKDKKKYPEIITAGTKENSYYTNSTMLPVNYTEDIFEALELQDKIQCKYTGGVVMHLFLGERISDIEAVKNLIRKIFGSFKLPYITLTPTFSICPSHGYLEGEHFNCPKCTIEQPCEVYTRIVGYLRPVNQFNPGKQQEFKERKEFKISR